MFLKKIEKINSHYFIITYCIKKYNTRMFDPLSKKKKQAKPAFALFYKSNDDVYQQKNGDCKKQHDQTCAY